MFLGAGLIRQLLSCNWFGLEIALIFWHLFNISCFPDKEKYTGDKNNFSPGRVPWRWFTAFSRHCQHSVWYYCWQRNQGFLTEVVSI